MNTIKKIKFGIGLAAFIIALLGLFTDLSLVYLPIITSTALLSIGLIADSLAKEQIVQQQPNVAQQPILQPVPPPPPKPKFICKICQTPCKNKKELSNHIIDEHFNDLSV